MFVMCSVEGEAKRLSLLPAWSALSPVGENKGPGLAWLSRDPFAQGLQPGQGTDGVPPPQVAPQFSVCTSFTGNSAELWQQEGRWLGWAPEPAALISVCSFLEGLS